MPDIKKIADGADIIVNGYAMVGNELVSSGGRTYRRYELNDDRKEIKKKKGKDFCKCLIISENILF